jgi:hypothetical protein
MPQPSVHLKRRRLLQWGLASVAVTAVAGQALSLLRPGLVDGRLGEGARWVLRRVAEAILEGSLPSDPAQQELALNLYLRRVDATLASLPSHTQNELSQLFSVLGSRLGCWSLCGLTASWDSASVAEVAAALQSMRSSTLSVRVQAYQGLHDLVCAPYFAGEETWALLGYPGPVQV